VIHNIFCYTIYNSQRNSYLNNCVQYNEDLLIHPFYNFSNSIRIFPYKDDHLSSCVWNHASRFYCNGFSNTLFHINRCIYDFIYYTNVLIVHHAQPYYHIFYQGMPNKLNHICDFPFNISVNLILIQQAFFRYLINFSIFLHLLQIN